ncbi:MAG: GntR family transcriptional regulator, partial [Pseudobacteriovorax sp.]|nr:GntR family transcriptional regulator [Pseudobacteriovorax sp.]
MPILLTNTKDTSGPTYRRVAESLRLLIVSGAIPRGSKLPSSRNLAEFNQIHRQTIMNAFGELMAQGYILAEERKAYYVARELPEDLQTGTSLTTLHNPTPYPWQWNQTANTQPRKRLVDLSSVRPDLDLLPWNEL